MPILSSLARSGALLAAFLLVFLTPPAHAQKVAPRDRAAVEALNQRMAAAEKRYREALVLSANSDPKATSEGDAALEDMEDVLSACIKQRGCQMHTLLTAYKRLLKQGIDGEPLEAEEDQGALIADYVDHTILVAELPEAARAAALLNDQRHAFDRMVEYNPAVQAGIRRWLTDMRVSLITSYENYQYVRPLMWPAWERRGLPEALLFGIMAKESNGRVHAVSRAGAAGLMQFMPATGQRFGLGQDGTGFDTRYDPTSVGMASAEYVNERFRSLNNNIEYSLAAYNGGEGRAQRVFDQSGGLGFWDEVVYSQFPGETKDYVPMVIAAAWLFLHPKEYGLEFPKVNAQPSSFRLARASSIYELTICLGNGGTANGYLRALRNLNPRYEADAYIPAGTEMKSTVRMAALYARNCVSGPRADLARTLVAADLNSAIRRNTRTGEVDVGDVTQVPGVAEARPAAPAKGRQYRIQRGDTLGKIALREGCNLKQLAAANGLKAPAYNVRPGQAIQLVGCKK